MRLISSFCIVQVLAAGVVLAGARWSVKHVATEQANSMPQPTSALAGVCLLPSSPLPLFKVVARPNQKLPTCTIGVVALDPISLSRAAQLAVFVDRRIQTQPRRRSQVINFADKATGQRFAKYQLQRHSAPLTARDYVALKKLWPHTLAFYTTGQKHATIDYPSRAPQDWWKPLLAKPRR